MTHNLKVEAQGKPRMIVYALVDEPLDSIGHGFKAGDVVDHCSGGGALLELHGDDWIIARFNDLDAASKYACLEDYYNPVPPVRPGKVDMTKVSEYKAACHAHREAVREADDMILVKGFEHLGCEIKTCKEFTAQARIEKARHGADTAKVAAISQAEAEIAIAMSACDVCCETLLTVRDETVTAKLTPITLA